MMKTIFRFGLPSQVARLLLLLSCLAVSDGRAASAPALLPEGSAPEAILSEARLSLAEARKTHSDPRVAVGWYLQAADRASRAATESSSNQASEARLIYNSASEEVTVLLWSNRELWNKAETIASDRVYTSYASRLVRARMAHGTRPISICFAPSNKCMKRFLGRRHRLTLGAASWSVSVSRPIRGDIFCRMSVSLAL